MTGLLHVSDRQFTNEKSRMLNEVQRKFKEVMVKEVTGLLHISDRLLAGELSRVEAARGALHPLPNPAYSNISDSQVLIFLVLKYYLLPYIMKKI